MLNIGKIKSRRHVLWQLEVLHGALDAQEWRDEARLLELVARPPQLQVWFLMRLLVKHGYAERRWCRQRAGRLPEREWRLRIDPAAGQG